MSAENEGAGPPRRLRESATGEGPPPPPGSLISWLIDWSLRNRFLVACGTLLIIAWGIWAIHPDGTISTGACRVGDLVPAIDGYWTVLAVMADRFANGERPARR